MGVRVDGPRRGPRPRRHRCGVPRGRADRIVVFVHGLSENEAYWNRAARPRTEARRESRRGAATASACVEEGWTPVYLRVNTGLPIAENGVAMAALLDRLVAAWPVDVRRIALVGHSMGGLIMRAACAVTTDSESPVDRPGHRRGLPRDPPPRRAARARGQQGGRRPRSPARVGAVRPDPGVPLGRHPRPAPRAGQRRAEPAQRPLPPRGRHADPIATLGHLGHDRRLPGALRSALGRRRAAGRRCSRAPRRCTSRLPITSTCSTTTTSTLPSGHGSQRPLRPAHPGREPDRMTQTPAPISATVEMKASSRRGLGGRLGPRAGCRSSAPSCARPSWWASPGSAPTSSASTVARPSSGRPPRRWCAGSPAGPSPGRPARAGPPGSTSSSPRPAAPRSPAAPRAAEVHVRHLAARSGHRRRRGARRRARRRHPHHARADPGGRRGVTLPAAVAESAVGEHGWVAREYVAAAV